MSVDDKIKVFDAEDNKLKLLGELLSNDTSRRIIKMLIQKESYTNEISKKLDIRVSLVIHHLKKLEQLGVLEINHKQIVRKGNNHRYFRMVPGLFLVPNETKEEMEKNGILKRIFREGIKFTIVPLIGITSWFVTETIEGIYAPYEPANLYDNVVIESDISIILALIITNIIFAYLYLKKNKGK